MVQRDFALQQICRAPDGTPLA